MAAAAILSSAEDITFTAVAMAVGGTVEFTAWEWTAAGCARHLGYKLGIVRRLALLS